MLTQDQIGKFQTDGYLVVEDVIPGDVLDRVQAEYSDVLNRLYDGWYEKGLVKDEPSRMTFWDKLLSAYQAGCDYFQPLDISLPGDRIMTDTPFHIGPAVFDLLTAQPMLDAVVEAGTHYVDLTGENHVIQDELDRHEEFLAANIMVMPAVGYDVVPTDCLNMHVAQNISEPTLLVLEMNGNYTDVDGTPASRGTIKSALELLSRPLLLRRDGEMVQVDQPKVKTREVNGQTQTLLQIPWADMVTSWVSTGVPTIEVYQLQDGTVPGWLPWLAQREWGKKLLVWAIDTFAPEGPPPEAQEKRQTRLVATATNRAGETFSAEMITPEPYRLTFHSTLLIANKILAGQWAPGFQTPAKMYGADLALEIPGVTRRDL